MAFKKAHDAGEVPASPLELFADLPRMGDAVPNLWGHQTGVLSEYVDAHVSTPDLAIELPTGTGKTVPGLLLADWRRRKLVEQVVYACPTVQLAHQAARVARREGIPAVTLVGSHASWPLAEVTRYDGAEAIAITNYSSVFNASPKLGRPGSLFFDDAHAAEQFVAEAWSVDISRFDDPEVYAAVVDAMRPALDGMFYQRLNEDNPDPLTRPDVRLVVPVRRGLVAELDKALSATKGNLGWRFTMARAGLASCLVYVSWGRVLVRPFVPPTFENDPFTAARQRVYLSATLGRGGELERAFGRASITRLELPPEAGTPRNGRRFFIFAGLASDGTDDGEDLTRALVQEAGKALVLAPTVETAVETANALSPAGWPVMDKDAVATSLEPFTTARHAMLALARYDGMDLPGATCRLVILDGKPDAAHLQERYLADQLRARITLEERIRTRVVQGAGRCTRGPADHAVVVILGDTLTRYLSETGVRNALTADLQAEVAFGRDNSRAPAAEVVANVKTFLAQGDEWRDNAEPEIAKLRRTASTSPLAGTEYLGKSVSYEIEACRLAWRGSWSDAAGYAEKAANALSGSNEVRHYRALWLYLAAVWFHAAADEGNPTARAAAEALVVRATNASRGTTWLREVEPADNQVVQTGADDTPAVQKVADLLTKGVKRASHEALLTSINDGLAATEAAKFEPALSNLGVLLGAEAYKPQGSGRCDSAWCWGERVWLAIEAKSGQDPTKPVALRDVRQANTQLRQLAADRGAAAPPDGSASIIVSPRGAVAPEAVDGAEHHVHLAEPAQLLAIAADAAAAWEELISQAPGQRADDLQRLIRNVLGKNRVLPTHVVSRLTATPLNGAVVATGSKDDDLA
ncbi:DEAD/DEAH box helicase [Micromonospora sp. HM5-17]|uniref:DEAD/DEAH box helicase n=1 Tax=Micromonospora sp. HM5-17 TaxID=2487710 RepID=UPI0011CD383C|nr:DEAD/DEAH box helicase [Micromonospora sp. HM5-17]